MSINIKRLLGKRALWIIGVCFLVLAIAVFVYLGYYFRWRWTGFPQKRLFDWIQILVIPVAVAIGTFVLNRAAKRRDDEAQKEQREREQAIETERAEEASLQAYLDYISGLLTDPDRPLRRTHMGDNLSVVARAQTLTVLGRLEDGERKSSVLQFLHEAGLIDRTYPVVNLQGANLKGAYLYVANLLGADLREALLLGADLREALLLGADLREADLKGAYLKGANLQEANLLGANLLGANLQAANLQYANLQYASLREANLQATKLEGADLKGANLQEADLLGANLREANLRGAWYLDQVQIDQAIGDNDTTLPEGIDRPKSWSARTDE
jgi:hypothetical protein